MLLLDFKKSYDRVEWSFLRATLEAFGFLMEFCNTVNTLLKDGVSQVDVNGFLSEEIPLGSSIRQGFPLASALFVIASNYLHYLLRDQSLSPKFKCITLSNQKELINIQFTNDTTILLELEENNLQILMENLDLFF